jgi:O-antigen/teichoic acid export membrane protein
MIARNALWNLAGFGLPLLVAVACIPPLIHVLGAPRFGLLTLLWAVINYFGLFDMGLGRALTHRLSAAMGSGREEEVGPVARDGLSLMVGLGVVAGIVLWVSAPFGVALLAHEGDPAEAVAAVRAIAWAMPFVLLTSGLRGVMEARGAFRPINVVRLVTGVAAVLAPLVVVQAGWNDLGVVAWVLGALRVFGCLAYAACVARMLPGGLALDAARPGGERLGELLRTGGWMTVANIIGPLMGYLDRFVIGAVGSMSAVAWYVTPQEIVSRLLIVPVSLASVLFPRLSELHANSGERTATWPLERLAFCVLFVALMPVTLVLGVFAHPILERWVGPEFAREGSTAMLVLCAGVLANSLAHVPFASIQARGNARATALLQMVELPLYVAGLWVLTSMWGVVGAALAWTTRIVVDLAALWIMARPSEVPARDRAGDAVGLAVAALTLAAFACAGLASPSWAVAGSLTIGAVAWVMAALRLRGDVPRLVSGRKADGLPR